MSTVAPPAPGQLVRLRSRTYLVEGREPSPESGTNLVRLACVDDDAQGQPLEAVWELEIDAEILDQKAYRSIGDRGFDKPRFFGAYINTLRWNCVTATDPALFQSPFRAGIRLDAYQLEPLRKALRLPRVNLFIADDVGLGKTIEAGLIASELLLRRRVRDVVVACPPSMILQWKDELETRFGLTFEILDREYFLRIREERGYGVNPWATFPRFIVSHRLLIDETYTAPMRDWLDNIRPGSLLIFDEAHHAAPSSGARFAIDSQTTKAVRDLAPRFEHRLFLSATPHNGHSNSFSALLELLDPQRFTRGVKVRARDLDPVMVRRLKDDIRSISGGFPERVPTQIDIGPALAPPNAPELVLSKLLDQYRRVRMLRVKNASIKKQNEAALVIGNLQNRLLSSVEAFARTLAVHRKSMEKLWAAEESESRFRGRFSPESLQSLDADDDRSGLPEEEQLSLYDEGVSRATELTAGDASVADVATEKQLLSQLTGLAEQARGLPDARVRFLIDWIARRMCPGARLAGHPSPKPGSTWSDVRVLIFTEWEDTRRYLERMLREAIAGTDQAEHRIEVFSGPTPQEKREAIKRAFNLPPDETPVRILIATDAAREGLNLQAYCHNLFHFDVPWNPSRLEQRNGRIDRKMQPADTVFCHYFVYTERPEDRVLKALVAKTERIRKELGSASRVIEDRLTSMIQFGFRHDDAVRIASEIEGTDLDSATRAVSEEELEAIRDRREKLAQQITTLRNRISAARQWIGFDDRKLEDALSCSLEILGVSPLQKDPSPGPGADTSGGASFPSPRVNGERVAGRPGEGRPRFVFPDLAARLGGDPTWAGTLDTLRMPPEDGIRGYRWRREAPVRPVIFEAPDNIDDDVVQLHLSHRVVQRLLSRFVSQGFIHHDLSRACLVQSQDAIPRVVLLGRLSVYGVRATRLHEEILTVTARWSEPDFRKSPLSPFGRDAEQKTVQLLEQALAPGAVRPATESTMSRLQSSIGRDVEELMPHLERRGNEYRVEAEQKLKDRGRIESDALTAILLEQRERVQKELEKHGDQRTLNFSTEEVRQFESNRRAWQRFLENVDGDLAREPKAILDFYTTASYRIEPVGVAYLWPVTG